MAITETIFEPKRYLVLKKSIPASQITDKAMYDEAGKKLGAYIHAHGIETAGAWSVLYFTWDEATQHTDIGIAFPVKNVTTVDDPEFTLLDVPSATVAFSIHSGAYEGLGAEHQALMAYCTEKKYIKGDLPVLAIEEYIVGPAQAPDPANWITNLYYFHK